MDMGEAIELATHYLLQRGEPMRERACNHPSPFRDMESIFATGSGNKIRSDAQGVLVHAAQGVPATGGRVREQSRVPLTLSTLKRKQRTQPWNTHQSVAQAIRGKCCYRYCPNLKPKAVRPRGYGTYMSCVECTAMKGSPVYFCNDTKSGKPCLCHLRYHAKHCKRMARM